MKDPNKQHWNLDHDPEARPLGCNGRYGKSGYNWHKYHKTEPCEACRDSLRHYERELARGQNYPRQLKPCGTRAAAQRHRARGEEPCLPCKLAETAEISERSRVRRAKIKAQTIHQF